MGKQWTRSDYSDMQWAFIEHYCELLKGADAARLAGYSEKSIYSIASENLRKPKIRAEIDRRLEAKRDNMKGELINRIITTATASIGDFMRFEVDKDTGVEEWTGYDFVKARDEGKLDRIKKLKVTKTGIEVELYDAQAARFKLAQIFGLDKQDELMLKLPPEVATAIGALGMNMDVFMKELAALLAEERGGG